MAGLEKLSALFVGRKQPAGRYGDGGGLYLQIGPTGKKAWIFRYKVDGREREMGLGSFADVPLAKARDKAAECRQMRDAGVDPLDARKDGEARKKLEAARAMTFEQCAEAFIAGNEAGWANPKHRQQWRNTLKTYAYPILGPLRVQEVDAPLVLKVLQPLWNTKPETASRLRGRIEAVLDWAKVNKHRSGENPAVWRGNLSQALPKRNKAQQVEHHAALPFEQAPAFIRDLRAREATAALALEFLIATAGRTGEVLGARWSEIDTDAALWTVPRERMKAKREHRVPLSAPALAVLARVKLLRRGDGFVFPGAAEGKPLSNMAMLLLLRRMKRTDLTAHGFRSTFRDWAAEATSFPAEVAEMALAHAVGDKVEAAYRRGDLFEKRRRLMNEWAQHCAGETPVDNVTKFPSAGVR